MAVVSMMRISGDTDELVAKMREHLMPVGERFAPEHGGGRHDRRTYARRDPRAPERPDRSHATPQERLAPMATRTASGGVVLPT